MLLRSASCSVGGLHSLSLDPETNASDSKLENSPVRTKRSLEPGREPSIELVPDWYAGVSSPSLISGELSIPESCQAGELRLLLTKESRTAEHRVTEATCPQVVLEYPFTGHIKAVIVLF